MPNQRIVFLVIFLFVYMYSSRAQRSRFWTSQMGFGVGTNMIRDNFDCTKKEVFTMELNAQYRFKERQAFGVRINLEYVSKINDFKLGTNVDLGYPNNQKNMLIASTTNYYQNAFLGPVYTYYFKEKQLSRNADILGFLSISSGLDLGSKQGITAYYYPYDTSLYKVKSLGIGGDRGPSLGFYANFAFGCLFWVKNTCGIFANYSFDYYNISIHSIYAEKTDKMNVQTTEKYVERISNFRQSIYVGCIIDLELLR